MFSRRTLRVVEMVALSGAIACLISLNPFTTLDLELGARSGYIVASS